MSWRRAARAAVSLLAVIGLAGCGARVAPGQPQFSTRAALASPSAGQPPAPFRGSPGVLPEGSTVVARQASPSPGPRQAPGLGSRHNNGVVRVTLSATCVAPGDLLIVTLSAPPKAGLGMVIGYADNQPHGAMNTGESDSTGAYVWRVPVAPTVPDGQARVLVTSTGANWKGEGGTADAVFMVARSGCG